MNNTTELITVDTFEKRLRDFKVTIDGKEYLIPKKDFVNYNKVTKRVQVSSKWAEEKGLV